MASQNFKNRRPKPGGICHRVLGKVVSLETPEQEAELLVNTLHGVTVALADCLDKPDRHTLRDWGRFTRRFDEVMAAALQHRLTPDQAGRLLRAGERAALLARRFRNDRAAAV